MSGDGKRVLVVGGADGLGNWLARRLFPRLKDVARITLADVAPLERIPHPRWARETASLPRGMDALRLDYSSPGLVAGWRPLTTSAQPPGEALALSDYDLVVLAVPEGEMETTAGALFPLLSGTAWVMDVCSVKEGPLRVMESHAREGMSVLGTHPLFGPLVQDAVGQTFVLVGSPRTRCEHVDWLRDALEGQGALVVEATAEEHDRYMLYVQTLTHFVYLAFSKALGEATREEGFDLGESFRFLTPPYASIVAFMGRIVAGNPRIYAQIQARPEGDRVRRLLARAVQELARAFADADESAVEEAILQITQPFRGRDIARGVSLSLAYVEATQSYYRNLHRLIRQGGLTVVRVSDPLRAGAPARFHAGVLVRYDTESLYLRERTAVKKGRYFVVYDGESSEAMSRLARRQGVVIPEAREVAIPHKRAQVLSPEETRRWREENLWHHTVDLPLVLDARVDTERVAGLLRRMHPDLVSVEVREAEGAGWLRRYGLRNLVFRLTVFGDRLPERVRDSALQVLEGLGAHVFRPQQKPSTE